VTCYEIEKSPIYNQLHIRPSWSVCKQRDESNQMRMHMQTIHVTLVHNMVHTLQLQNL
jgi:hypothetical protein